MNANELIKYITETLIPSGDFDMTPGRHELDGASYYNVDVYTSKELSSCRYEAHKRYIDIQYLVKGHEKIYVTDISNLQITEPYSEERDIMFFSGGDHVEAKILEQGNYLIFYPKDGHKPCVHIEQEGCEIEKVVFKVKIDE